MFPFGDFTLAACKGKKADRQKGSITQSHFLTKYKFFFFISFVYFTFLLSYFYLFPPTLSNQRLDGVIQLISLHQLFDTKMHPIAPVVTRVSRNIDALSILVGQA